MSAKSLKNILYKTTVQLKRNSPTILTCFAACGLVATTVTAIRATPKAMKIVEEAKKGDTDNTKRDLEKTEIVRLTWKYYIPSAVFCVTTLICMFGANALNKRQQAQLMSAYAIVNQSYKRYTSKVKELYGEDVHKTVTDAIVKEDCKDISVNAYSAFSSSSLDFDDGNSEVRHTFYDSFSNRYFETTISKVLQAEYHLNRNFTLRGDNTVNEFYEFLGLASIDGGDYIGWAVCDEVMWIDFDHQKTVLDDGMEVYIIEPVFTPLPFDEWESYSV